MWLLKVCIVHAVLLSAFAQQQFQPEYVGLPVGQQQNSNVGSGNPSPNISRGKKLFAEQIGSFSLQLLKASARSNDRNTVLSPFSVATLLSLLQQASTSSTLEQLTRTLNLTPQQSRGGFNEIIKSLSTHNSKSSLENANAIFLNAGVNLNNAFRTEAYNSYGAGVIPVDFKDSRKAANEINSWVAQVTHNAINDLVDQNGNYAGLEMILVNALYFKGVWQSKFTANRTTVRSFSPQPGVEIPAEFMYQSDKYNVGDDLTLGAKWIEKSYDGDEFSMLFVLPTEQHGLEELLQKLTGADIFKMLNTIRVKNAVVLIPKFKLSTALSLIDPLKRLGLTEIFTPGAHLEGLTDPARNPAVSDVVHRAEIVVNEEGTRAAAASSLVVNTLSLGSYYDDFRFEANQPFLAIVVDKVNSLPLFICKINNPTL